MLYWATQHCNMLLLKVMFSNTGHLKWNHGCLCFTSLISGVPGSPYIEHLDSPFLTCPFWVMTPAVTHTNTDKCTHTVLCVCVTYNIRWQNTLILTRFLMNDCAASAAVHWKIIPVLKEHGKTGSAHPTADQDLARLTFALGHGI